MHVKVDYNACLRHGHCCGTAPEVFQLDDAGLLQHVERPSESSREAVERAADDCPTQAIIIEG